MGVEFNESAAQSNSIADSLKAYAEEVKAEKAEKQEKYELAKSISEALAGLKYRAEKKFKNAESRFMQGNEDSGYNRAKAEYNSASSAYRNAENNAAILRSSYQDSIFYSGKVGIQAIVADAMLA